MRLWQLSMMKLVSPIGAKITKMAFNALGGIATGIAANIATNQVAPLVAQALALL